MIDLEKVPDWEREYHARVDPHGGASALSDVILGGQDGIVNLLGALLGMSAAGAPTRLVLAAGVAAAFAEAISMTAVAYTSSVAKADQYRSERAREYRHLRAVPALEREEVRELYARKGLRGELLDRVVDAITADPDVWVAVMMAEEHGLAPFDRVRALRSAAIVGLSTLVGALVPIGPFAAVHGPAARWASAAVTALALLALGAYKAKLTVGRPLRSGLELAAIGMASALAGWGIGALLGASG